MRAERVCLSLAKRCIMERDQVRTGQDYLARLRAVRRSTRGRSAYSESTTDADARGAPSIQAATCQVPAWR